MNVIAPQWLFAVIGPLFFVLGIVRCVIARRVVAQSLTWLILGVTFTAVAIWLWVRPGVPLVS